MRSFLIIGVARLAIDTIGPGVQEGLPGIKPQPHRWSDTHMRPRAEPAWSHSKLLPGRPEFRQIREEILTKYGRIPNHVPQGEADKALAAFRQSQTPSDAFRARYLWFQVSNYVPD